MSRTTQENYKALVLEAFDTLFNRRDYAAAERYWSQLHPTQRPHRARPRGPLQPRQEPLADAQIGARGDRR
jgi:hypothetical protein